MLSSHAMTSTAPLPQMAWCPVVSDSVLAAEMPTGHKQPIGMGTGVPHSHNRLYCFNLCVLPRYRRRGLGELVMRQLQVVADDLGCASMTGTVSP